MMKFKTQLTLLVMLFVGVSGFAQSGSILKGKVTDQSNIGLIGVNILIANTSQGTVTDFDGNYEIDVKPGDVLQFSYTGYTDQSVTISNQTELNVTMVEGALLDEVVVVGYGTRKKSHNTGAIAQVGGDDVAAIQAARIDDALAGKMAGVLIQNQSGEVGADPKIQIRAASSITGNSNPLIVVDGYPISGSLATINPNDIESIEVLKDAASAAIYGSRGANGVILVSTKKGQAGKTKFSYDAYVSSSQKYRDNINMTAGEWADHADAQIASGAWDVSELESIAPGFVDFKIWGFRNSPDVVAIEDHLFGTGFTQSHNFSASGGNEDTKFFASVGYQDIDGVVRTQAFERINARLNVDSKLGDRFKTGLSFNGFTSDRSAVEHDMRDVLRGASIHPIYHTPASIAFINELQSRNEALGIRVSRQGGVNSTVPFNSGAPREDIPGTHIRDIADLQPGDPAWDFHYGRAGNGIGGSSNPGTASLLDNKSNTEKSYFANLSAYLEFSLTDDLTLKTILGGDLNDFRANQHNLAGGDNNGELKDTYLDQQKVQRTSGLSETTLNYTKVIDKHDISALAGIEFQKFFIRGNSIFGNNVSQKLGEALNYSLLAPQDVTVSTRDEEINRESVFGRINYAFDNRYLASVSIRRDGDSRFGRNNKYEVFPAFSLGWNVHNESFYNNNFLTDLKFRVSYGSLGTTSNLGAYNSLSILNPGVSALGNSFLIPNDVANPNLTWQTNTETNFGVNLGFLDNRFTFGVDYYTSDIEDILIDQSVSEVFGTNSVKLNSGDVTSSGIELNLGAALVNTADLRWDVNANLSTVNTEITDLGPLTQLPDQNYGTSGRAAVWRNYVGGEIGELWALETDGWVEERHMINPLDVIGNSSGEVYVIDQNGDGIIDRTKGVDQGGDLIKIGTNTPDFYWGLSSSVGYKDFDLGIQFSGAHGGVVYNVDPLYNGSNWGGRLRSSFDAEGDGIEDATGKHYLRARDRTDAVIQSASFVALRNITLGYTLGAKKVENLGLGSVRLYVAATNPLYIMGDDYTSYNPEGVDTGGTGYGGPTTYGHQSGESPILKSFTFGLNVNF